MTGPLTPPPTSDTEIKDAAHNSVSPPTASSSNQSPWGPSTPGDHYQVLFLTIAELASKGNYKELVKVAERGDLKADGRANLTRLLLTTPLVLSYLILDEILPNTLQSQQLSRDLFSLLAATSERKYGNVYSRASQVYDTLKKPLDPNYDLTAVGRALVNTFIETFRRKTLILLSRAYTSIPVPLAQSYLGLTPEQTIEAARIHKWKYDASSQVLYPTPIKGYNSSTTGASGQSTVHTLRTVTAGNFEEK